MPPTDPMQQQVTDGAFCTPERVVPQGAHPGASAAQIADIAGLADLQSRLRAILSHTVERDVIPRLLAARRKPAAIPLDAARATMRSIAAGEVTREEVDDLVTLLLAHDEAASLQRIERLHEAGIPAETLYLDLLTPAARKLGQMWVDDDCDFTDVTVGLFVLQSALRELGSAFPVDAVPGADAPRALLVPLPGEQHTFGLSMVFDFFRRAGWNAWSGPVASEEELAAMLRGSWFDMIGLSLVCDEQLDSARRVIRIARAASLNPAIAVMAGGPGFADNPGLAALIGADGTAPDGRAAVRQANALVALAATRMVT